MDTVIGRIWTVDRFLAWEDRQEGKHEFDGRTTIPMTGGSIAHQRIVVDLMVALLRLLGPSGWEPVQEMRVRCGDAVRYPDIAVCAGGLDQGTRTLTDAMTIFEVLSPDTAIIDRTVKPAEYAVLPSLRSYVLLEQTAMAATLFQRALGGDWVVSTHTDGVLALPGLGIDLPLAEVYRRVRF